MPINPSSIPKGVNRVGITFGYHSDADNHRPVHVLKALRVVLFMRFYFVRDVENSCHRDLEKSSRSKSVSEIFQISEF